jgi:hypothetical protein
MAKIKNTEEDRRLRQNRQNNIRGAKISYYGNYNETGADPRSSGPGTKKIPMSNSAEAKTERLRKYKNKERIKFEKTYEFNKPKKSSGQGTGKVVADRAAKAGGRAQPKGTAPRTPSALPPRTGPSAGGGSSLYSRLTGGGGLRRHGR